MEWVVGLWFTCLVEWLGGWGGEFVILCVSGGVGGCGWGVGLCLLYLLDGWVLILPVSGGVGMGLYLSCIWWSRWMGGFLSFLFLVVWVCIHPALVEWVWVCIHPASGGVGVGSYPSCI